MTAAEDFAATVRRFQSIVWLAIEAGVYGKGRDKRPEAYDCLASLVALADGAAQPMGTDATIAVMHCEEWRQKAWRAEERAAQLEAERDEQRSLSHEHYEAYVSEVAIRQAAEERVATAEVERDRAMDAAEQALKEGQAAAIGWNDSKAESKANWEAALAAEERAAKLETAPVAAAEETLRVAKWFISLQPLTDVTDPTGEGREIANDIMARIDAALSSGLPEKTPHDDKGFSEEKCVRCGWVMGNPPLNCQNDDTAHLFPSGLPEKEEA